MSKYWPAITGGLVVFAVALSFSFGMRVNFDALQRHTNKAPFIQVKLKNGQVLVGKFVKESPQGLTLDMGGGDMMLTPGEMTSRKELSAEEVQSGDYASWMGSTKAPDIVTFREEDNLWIQWGIMKGTPRPTLTLAPMPKLKPKTKQSAASQSSATKSEYSLPDRSDQWNPGATSSQWDPASSSAGTETPTGAKSGVEGQPVKIAPGSMLDIYKKMMSPESIEAYKKQTINELNSAPRNPFVEVAKATQLANTKAVTSAENAEENTGDLTQS